MPISSTPKGDADGTGTMTGDEGLNEFTWTPIDGGFKTKGEAHPQDSG